MAHSTKDRISSDIIKRDSGPFPPVRSPCPNLLRKPIFRLGAITVTLRRKQWMPIMPEPGTVSVVICTYNRKQWLERCLGSLEGMTRKADEVIVVDGPSNDGTRERILELQGMGKVRLVPQSALEGISAARNLGLEAASGDITCFIDDDAVAEPGWLEQILIAYKDDRVGGVGGPVLDIEGRLAMGRNAVSRYGDWYDESKGGDLSGLYPVMVGCNMSFRTTVLREVGGFDPFFRFHQDETDACLRVLLNGYEIRYVEGAKVKHEWCEGSYRKDRLRWYLRLRYLWGRNNAHLVKKNFGREVSFSEYIGNVATRSMKKRSSPHASSPIGSQGPRKKGYGRLVTSMGNIFEMVGTVFGWR